MAIGYPTEKYASTNFLWAELACKGCDGSCVWSSNGRPLVHIQEEALAKLQELRSLIGKPFSPNSATRCPRHNRAVGGAPLSQHRATLQIPSTAFDIPLVIPKGELISAAEEVGFTGIGVNYKTFVHVDNREHRARW